MCFLKDGGRDQVKWSISPGDQYTPVWVNRRHTHTELSFLPERKCSVHKYLEFANWKNLCSFDSGRFFKHWSHMDSLYSYLSLCSLVPSEMSWGYGKHGDRQTHTFKDTDTHRLSLICHGHCVFDSRLFPSEDLLFCFAMILLSDWQPCYMQCSADMLLCKQMKAARWEKSRLIWNSTEKHACMSPCLHSELIIHEHRCLFFFVCFFTVAAAHTHV